MKAKRILALLLAAIVSTSVASCNKKKDNVATVAPPEKDAVSTEKDNTAEEADKVTSMTAQEYLSYILLEKDNTVSEIGKAIDTLKNTYNTTAASKGTMRIKTAEGLETLLGDISPDILEVYKEYSWLNDIGIDFNLDMDKKKNTFLVADYKINDTFILSSEFTIIPDDEMAYIKVPTISDAYIGTKLEGYSESYQETLYAEYIINALPDSKVTEALLTKYFGIILEGASDVTKVDETVSADGITVDASKVSFVIDSDYAYSVSVKLSETATNDPEIKAFFERLAEKLYTTNEFNQMYDSSDAMVDRIYTKWDSSLADLKDSKDGFDGINNVTIEIYTSKDDEVIGFTMKNDEFTLIDYRYAEKDGKFGIQVSCCDEMAVYALHGNGTKTADKISADLAVQLNIDGEEELSGTVAKLSLKDIDIKLIEDGIINGTVELVPGDVVGNIEQYGDLISACGIVFDFKQTKKDESLCTLTFNYNGNNIAVIDCTAATKAPTEITIPTEYYDLSNPDHQQEYLGGLDVSAIVSNLSTAGVLNNFLKIFGVL